MTSKSPNGHFLDCECPDCDKYGAPWRRRPPTPYDAIHREQLARPTLVPAKDRRP